jgi:DNA (cytosine-5)-methyltransferase 1
MPGRRKEDDVNLVEAFAWQQGDDSKFNESGRGRSWITRAGDYTGALSKTRHDAVAGQAVGVRRLTPTECERLQALPDGWTDFGPDSRRYSALGDAVTSTVAEWIGRRLACAVRVMDGLPPDEDSPANRASCNFPTETVG